MNKIRIYHGSLEQVPMPDFVYGPVANDRVYAAFALYESGLLNKQELIVELKAYELIDQLLFHTPASLQLLTFVQSIEIPL